MPKRNVSKAAIDRSAAKSTKSSALLERREVPTGYKESAGVTRLLERRSKKP